MNLKTKSLMVFLTGIILSLSVTFILPVLEREGILLDSFYEQTSDWRTLFFSKKVDGQRDDIAVILISENSIYRYPSRSPVDRNLLASLVQTLDKAGASVIGLDFIFDRPTVPEKDNKLIDAIKNAKTKIILGKIDSRSPLVREEAFKFQLNFHKQAAQPSGHIYFAGSNNIFDFGDGVVRKVAPKSTHVNYGDSFAKKLAEHDGKSQTRPSDHIAWLRGKISGSLAPFPIFEIPEHKPEEAESNPDKIFPESWRAALKGKIVLIGGDFVDRDRHYTPLSIYSRERIPGVLVHAHIVAQLRDGNFISEVKIHSEMIGLFLITLLGFVLSWRFQLGIFDVLAGFLGLVAITIIGALAFWWLNILVPSSFLLAWIIGGSVGHFTANWSKKAKQEAGQ